MKKIKWGVLGSGGIARRRTIPEGLARAANAQLTTVFDPNAQANAEVAKSFGAAAAGTVAELLNSDVDAVYIASPPGVHREQVLAAARAGKHVLCEKPLGMTVGETEIMLETCREANVLFGTAFMMRFQAQHQAAAETIRQGKLGKPVFARAQLSCWYPPIPGAWRQDPEASGGGSLIDMGGHCIDLLEMFFGPVKAVSCLVNCTVHSYKSEDSAVATLSFQNGAIGVVDTFFCIPDESSRNVLELYGSQGSILAQGTIGQGECGQMIARIQGQAAGYDAQQARSAGAEMVIAPSPVNMYRAEIEEFSQAILEGRQPSNNAQLGLQSQKVLAACYESARSGKVISLA